jgi:NTP pyrophosphatase (non-canonical NTP hydrolase)
MFCGVLFQEASSKNRKIKREDPYSIMNKYRDETAVMCQEKGWDKAPISIVWMLLNEEMGELASSIRQKQRIYKKTGLKKDRGTDIVMEMGDVFSYLFQLAFMLNIDLDEMWQLHQQKIKTKFYKNNVSLC